MMQEDTRDEGSGLYDKLATKAPEREVGVEIEKGSKSLDEKEAEDPNLSDLQTALRRLFPELGDNIDNALMFARIAPDMFIALIRILVNSAIKRMDPRKPLDVAKQATLFYVLASIGLDGKGRIDTIETTGSVKEAEELAELTKGLI